MNLTRNFRRILSAMLALIMVVALMPVNAKADGSDPVVVIAASDYQNTNGGYFSSGAATDAYAIMNAVKEDYSSAYGFLFGGDYYAHDTNTTTYSANGKKQLKEEIVDVLYPSMDDDTQIYIQGNHDADSLTTNGTLTTSGAHDTDYYGVYVINEKDYMWYNNSQSTIKSTASALSSYLEAKMDEGYDKPIFVLSHLPLHYTNRTKNEGDGKYAKYLYDVMDEAGDNGLNIIFLYGHNHSTAYDSYLGNGSVYLPIGSSIAIANEGSTTSCFTDTLTFTYMNYGFVGYVGSSNADSALTMTVFEITDDQVTVKRYDEDGLHNLKSAGGSTQLPSGLSVNSTVIGTAGATIALTAPKEKATYTSNGVTVTAVGLTGVTATKAEEPVYNSALYSGYEEYTVTTTGYEEGKTATVAIALTDGDFDTTRSITVKFPDGSTESAAVLDGAITVETDRMGTFILMQNKRTGVEVPETNPDDAADGNIWRQVDSFTAGKKYILINYGNNASGVGEYAINSSAAPTAVTVQSDSNGAYIETENMAIAWTAEANEGQFELVNADTGYYLHISTYPSGTGTADLAVVSSVTSGTSYSNWSMESNSNTDSALSARRATSSNYYPVRYSNGGSEFLAYTSTQTSKYDNWVAIFEQTSEGGSSESVIPDAEDGWVSLPSGGTYTLDTNGIDVGANNKYIIVGNDNNYALTLSDGIIGQAAVTVNGNTISVDDPSIYEFYFADNSSNESSSYLLTQDGTNTVYHANGNMYYGSDNKGYWHFGSSSNGSYQIYDNDNSSWYLNYGYVWSSETANRFAVSSRTRYVRLYKSNGSVYEDTYLRLAGETEQTYTTTEGATVDSVLENVYIEVTTDGYYVSDIIDVSSSMVIWDKAFDGTAIDTYTGTVTYEGQDMGTFTVTITAEEHAYETVTVEATCTEDGSITTKCTICGEETVEVIEALGHDYECVETEATCGKDGSKVYTCTVCEDTYTETIPATGNHSYESVTVDATCAADGSVTYTCVVCDDSYVESIPATGDHAYEAVTVDATCIAAGSVTYTCAVCGDSYTEVITATGHNYVSVVTGATCTEGGFTTYTCSGCGDSYVADHTVALGHRYETATVDATCTTDGSITYYCAACGDIYTETIMSTGHSYQTVVTAPTCDAEGYTTHTCTSCGDSYVTDHAAALGHNYDTVTVAPTCTVGGYTTHTCTVCGHGEIYDETAALGHDYVSVTVDPTETEGGYTTYTCNTCGHSYTDNYVDALGHTIVSVVTEATCTTEGYTTHTCTTCGEVTVDTYVPALGHNYQTVTVEATCTTDGSVSGKCTTCGDAYYNVTTAYGHNYTASVTAPTCTEGGHTVYSCDRCGDNYVDNYTEALGHNYTSITTDVTCTEDGYTTHLCTNCGDSYVGDTIEALGHNYQVITADATCTENGSITHICSNCGDSYAEEIPATGHNYQAVVTEPTCTAEGYTTYTCANCGNSYAEVIAATGHDYQSVVTVPTCTEGGYTTHTCADCGDSYVNSYTNVADHSYTCVESDGYLVYTCYNCGSSYSEKIENLTYTRVSSISSGDNYVITLYSGRKYYALSHEDNKISVVQVTVSNKEITSEITEDLVWTYSNKKLSYEDGDTTYYLYAGSSSNNWWGNWWGSSSSTLSLSTSNSSSISFSNSKLKVGSKYLRYSNGSISLNSSATTTYCFIEE